MQIAQFVEEGFCGEDPGSWEVVRHLLVPHKLPSPTLTSYWVFFFEGLGSLSVKRYLGL